MHRKKILWLVSWYPNRNDRFDGDFIQRHARAAAICHDIHVIYVAGIDIHKPFEQEWQYATGLTEQIVYFKKPKGVLDRLVKQWRWRKLYEKAVEDYIAKNGLPDIVHVHVPWKAGIIALNLKKKYGIQYIVTEHWGIYNKTITENFYARPAYFQRFLKAIFRESKLLVSVSSYLAESVLKITGAKEYSIIPNVVDTTLFYYKDEKYSKFTFIHVSNMVPLKNVQGILEAFKTLVEKEDDSDLQLVLVGNKNDEYIHEAKRLGLFNSSVFLRGEVPYNQVAEEMQMAHCFVLNSDIENSPCVIGEALCCGLPVIATRVGGVPELIDNTNGILIPPNDSNALAIAMLQMKNNYQDYSYKYITEEASKKYSYSTISNQFDQLYRSL